MPQTEKVIYLTFDDGPIPEVTPWVLEQLKAYNAEATFFCVGENVAKHTQLFEKVKEAGHSIGNHTYHHINGWLIENVPYFLNIRKCASIVNSELFRPPYGKLKPKQANFLQRHYHIVMWDVLSGDFDPKITKEQCLKNVLDNTGNGSIIVFHDSLKAKEKLEFVLPKVLEHFNAEGYVFKSITTRNLAQIKPNYKIA